MNKKTDSKREQEKPKRTAGRPKKEATPKVVEDSAQLAASPAFDFVGKVDAIRVVGAAGAEVFEFTLRGRDDAHGSFRLKASEPFALAAMVPLILSAHAQDSKIGVRVEQVEGASWVTEIESRPGLGKKS